MSFVERLGSRVGCVRVDVCLVAVVVAGPADERIDQRGPDTLPLMRHIDVDAAQYGIGRRESGARRRCEVADQMPGRLSGEIGDEHERLVVREESLEVASALSSWPGRVGEWLVSRCVGCEEFAFEPDQGIEVAVTRSANHHHGPHRTFPLPRSNGHLQTFDH